MDLHVPTLSLQVALCSKQRNFSVAHLIINYSTVPWQLPLLQMLLMMMVGFTYGFLMVFCGVAVCLLFDAGFVGFPSTSQVPPFAPCQSLAEPPGSPQYMTALYGHMPP